MPYKNTGRPNGRPKKQLAPTGSRPALTELQWKGVRFEADHPKANQSKIAEALRVTRSAVSRWHKSPHYNSGRLWLKAAAEKANLRRQDAAHRADIRRQAAMIVRRLEERDAARMTERTKSAPRPEEWETRIELMWGEIVRTWAGSVESPLDGKTYTDPKQYHEHVKNWRFPDGSRAFWLLPEENRLPKR